MLRWILRKLGDFWMQIGWADGHERPSSLKVRNYLAIETTVTFSRTPHELIRTIYRSVLRK